MRKNMKSVIEAFVNLKSKNEKTCHTDGTNIYSYNMLIAKRENGEIFILPYKKAPSNITRSQVRALKVTFPNAKEMF